MPAHVLQQAYFSLCIILASPEPGASQYTRDDKLYKADCLVRNQASKCKLLKFCTSEHTRMMRLVCFAGDWPAT